MTFGNYVNRDIETGKVSRPIINCNKHNFRKIIKTNSFRDRKLDIHSFENIQIQII